ncbi:MAG: YfiR family protein [Sphingobacteriales bacterium]|nr:MAG: YfiR family protein [Sphingobacteriales bacterium]
MLRACFPILLLFASILTPPYAQDPTEYQVKANFLLNFSKFIDWPADAFPTPDAPVVVGILGIDPFGKYIDDIVSKEEIANRSIVVRRYNNLQDVFDCQILYINQPWKTEEVVSVLKGKSILTVSDEPGFAKAGGNIQFYNDSSVVKLEINGVAAKESKLNISSKLLRIARIAETDTAK